MERFYNQDSGFGVYTFYTPDDIPESRPYHPTADDAIFSGFQKTVHMSTLAGCMQQLYLGTEYKVEAELQYNKKYNSYQYKPITILATTPKNVQQQKAFLQSIINPRQADVLLEKYPNIVEDVVNKRDNVDTSTLKGIKDYTWKRIKEAIINNYVISDILVMLQPLGVSYNMIKKLVDSEPNPALLKDKLLKDPYIMTKIRGLGFKKVDDLALKLNPDLRVSTKRVYAFIRFHLNYVASQEGHTWIYISQLKAAAKDSISECMELLEQVISSESSCRTMFVVTANKIGLRKYYEYEMDSLDILRSINKMNDSASWNISQETIEAGIKVAEEQQGFIYTQEQSELIRQAVQNNVTVISGKAGTGKTSISRGIINIYKKANKSIACCALSAKAAQRITEATGNPSSTIHRLLGWSGTDFCHNHDNPLQADVLFLDEASMVNVDIFYHLVCAVKEGARVILCGDNRQLPPIGAGNIFSDLLEYSKDFNVNKLTKVQRQAQDSGILSDANKIREGINPLEFADSKIVTGKLQDMVYMFRDSAEVLQQIAIKTFFKSVEKDGYDDVIIVTPRRTNCPNSSAELNKKIAAEIFAGKPESEGFTYGSITFYPGIKVMQQVNNYDKNVFNGEIGYVDSITTDEKRSKVITVKYPFGTESKMIQYNPNELSELDLAYALTCHKCQGSGYKTVIAIIDTSHYIMLDSCLLYTAITRAKKRCLLLADPKAFIRCINTNKSTARQTWLSEMPH